jgi:hypothetical protein
MRESDGLKTKTVWSNFETEIYSLWNGDYWFDYVRDHKITDKQELAEIMQERTEYNFKNENIKVPMFSDFVINSIREVNFYELAEKIIDEQ